MSTSNNIKRRIYLYSLFKTLESHKCLPLKEVGLTLGKVPRKISQPASVKSAPCTLGVHLVLDSSRNENTIRIFFC